MKDVSVEKEGSDKFILTNNGAYFFHNKDTKYQGLYFPEKKDDHNWTLFKTVEEINFDAKVTKLNNNFSHIVQDTDKGYIMYYFHQDGLLLKTSVKGDITITLDMREIYDFDDKGRVYNIIHEHGCIIIEYKKFWDNGLEQVNYTKYLAIKTDISNWEKISQWRENEYKEDEKRKSYPYKLYVVDAIKLKNNHDNKIAIAYSKEKEDAIHKAKKVFESEPKEYELKKKELDNEKKLAYNAALKSLEDLYINFDNIQGYYAGLPWFFQVWTRDEAISLKAVMDIGKLDIAKKILLKRISHLDEGKIPNRFPFSELKTADGTGWVFKRFYDLLERLIKDDKVEQYLSPNNLKFVREVIKVMIIKHKDELLIKNQANETWMDTSYKNDTREGYRIEIQALWLSMLKLMNALDKQLSHELMYKELEEKTKNEVKKIFFDKNILKDGKDDSTIRPNIFLAYYLYPELLNNKEWEAVFDNALDKLWLEWGGLSTIEKSSELYCDEYTGEDNKSYHRGDSWFFINNIAALCMKKLNKDKYKRYIDKIIEASTKDILFNGIISRPSELSSAKEQRAEASLFQLWSAATFIELIE